jgi:hypothetical protein
LGPTQQPDGLVHATGALEAALKLPRARELACGAMEALRSLSAAQAGAKGPGPQAAGLLLGSVAPLVRLAAEALRVRALQLLALHLSTAKLSYVCTAIMATLVEEGYCVPEESREVEGEWSRGWCMAGMRLTGPGGAPSEVPELGATDGQLRPRRSVAAVAASKRQVR